MAKMKDILDRYPTAKRFLNERNTLGLDMIGPQTMTVKDQQTRAFDLIDRLGTGTTAEKSAVMICAACVIEPPSLFYNVAGLLMNYGPEVEKVVERVMGTPAGMNFDPMTAQARAAAGTVMMEDYAAKLAAGEPLGGKPEEVLSALQKAFGKDSSQYVELQNPQLMGAFETARDSLYSALQSKINETRPKFGGGNFDL